MISGRFSRWLVGVAVIGLFASACTFGEETTDGGDDGDGGARTVTLRMWAHRSPSFNQALRDSARAYEADHPNVTIELEAFAYTDFLEPVPESVVTLSDAEEAFYPGPLGGYVCDGTLYGVPQESNLEYGATLVNTAMAEAAGADTGGWSTWDEFIADARQMTVIQDGVVTRAGYHFTAGDGLAHSFLSLILQAGGNYLNEDGTAFTFNTPEGEEALTLLKSIVDAGATDPVLYNDVDNWVGDCYFTELCAMGLVGPWAVADYAGDYPQIVEDTVYSKLPSLENESFVADSGWGLTVPAGTPNADAAWDFVRFSALDAEVASQWNITSGTLPALIENAEGSARDELIAAFPHFETWFEVLPNARFVGQLPDRDRLYYNIIYNHGLAALRGDETIPEALQAMETEANETFG